MYFYLINVINPMYIQWLGEMVPPSSPSTVGICKQITLLVRYYITSRLVTIFKSFMPLYKSLIFLI